MLISICIPTFRRCDLLRQAIRSCLEQQHRPLEILIGDDSPTNEAESLISHYRPTAGVTFRYMWNRSPMGQAANINRLFCEAQGEKLVLVHDDDLLLPGAVDTLLSCWQRNPKIGAAFGKQVLISEAGDTLLPKSEGLNRDFYRTAEYEGTKLSPIESGLLQQFPNDGYMVITELVRQVLLRDEDLVGDCCDFDFGVRLGLIANQFCFVDQYTAKYRLTGQAISHKQETAYMFRVLERLDIPAKSEWARKIALERLAPLAILRHAQAGNRHEAWRIYTSASYCLKKRVSVGGLRKLASIVLSHS
jgi:glycosyltransferase involved in cell wall biosynthesis